MAARPIASGIVSFGLVAVPVKLYSATSSKSLSFNMLHKKDRARLKQQYICSDLRRGRRARRHRARLRVRQGRVRGALRRGAEGARAEERPVDRDRGVRADRAGRPDLLRQGLSARPRQGRPQAVPAAQRAPCARAASARSPSSRPAASSSWSWCAQAAEGLVLHTLFYADEVRSFADVDLGDEVATKPAEVELAVQLIEQLASDRFDAEPSTRTSTARPRWR